MSVFAAKPVPSGMTVIATPVQPDRDSSSSSGSLLQQLSPGICLSKEKIKFNPDATPFVPKQREGKDHEAEDEEETSKELMAASSSTDEASSGGQPGRKTPCFMYWSAECPEGALIPLRQPQPPVYFEPVK